MNGLDFVIIDCSLQKHYFIQLLLSNTNMLLLKATPWISKHLITELSGLVELLLMQYGVLLSSFLLTPNDCGIMHCGEWIHPYQSGMAIIRSYLQLAKDKGRQLPYDYWRSWFWKLKKRWNGQSISPIYLHNSVWRTSQHDETEWLTGSWTVRWTIKSLCPAQSVQPQLLSHEYQDSHNIEWGQFKDKELLCLHIKNSLQHLWGFIQPVIWHLTSMC